MSKDKVKYQILIDDEIKDITGSTKFFQIFGGSPGTAPINLLEVLEFAFAKGFVGKKCASASNTTSHW